MAIETAAVTFSALSQGFQQWQNRKELSRKEKDNMNKAIGAVMDAVVATKAYLYDSVELGNPSREREQELSQLWQTAATTIRRFDDHLFYSSQVKSLGWADPREWSKQIDKAVTVRLDDIIKQCEHLREQCK